MSGHSKWATIKRKKALVDAKKGKEFTKLIKEITICARLGGGDPAGNARLRLLLEKAKEANMPTENAQRAIKRGTGELPGVHYEEHLYEGYGPHGIAVIVDTLTDNKNRTVAELRRMFTSSGGSLAENGAVSWMFHKLGVIRAAGMHMSDDQLLELLLEFDIKDIDRHDDVISVTCDPKSLDHVRQTMKDAGFTIETAELEWVASNSTPLDDEQTEKASEFLSELEDLDDVKNVYTNLGG